MVETCNSETRAPAQGINGEIIDCLKQGEMRVNYTVGGAMEKTKVINCDFLVIHDSSKCFIFTNCLVHALHIRAPFISSQAFLKNVG